MDKIETIGSKFQDKKTDIPSVQKPEIKSKMNAFERTTKAKIKKLILGSLSKSCHLYPIHISVPKNCLDAHINPYH